MRVHGVVSNCMIVVEYDRCACIEYTAPFTIGVGELVFEIKMLDNWFEVLGKVVLL
jgi:hypothetical protein